MRAKELFDKGGDLVHKLRSESDIIRHIKTREGKTSNYSLFLGAGASVNSGIRTAKQLNDEWLFELYERFNRERPNSSQEAIKYFKKDHANWYNPANPYSSLFEKKYDLPSQRRRFIEQEVDQKVPSIGYAYLVSLVDQVYFNTIFTTNFDDLVNEAFYQFSNNRPIYCAHDSSIHSISITSKRPKILKIHGDYLFDDIKSTLKETESLEQNTKEKLIEFCKEFGLIVIGYSGNDRSVMDVLEFLTKQENYLKNGIYWCLREEDKVSLALRNLLWKDKVYPVLIEGFDQFLAKAYHEMVGAGLDIESNIKQSKLQKTIHYIVEDKYNLSQNEHIKKEIEIIKDSNSKNDISSFINDLSKDSDSDLPLSDFRNLLEVEDLFNKSNIQGAYDLCEAHYQNSEIHTAKSKYLSKLIFLSKSLDSIQLALKWSDRLIELDRYDLSYNLKKSDCIFDLKKRFEFLNDLIKTFPCRYEIYNETAQIGYALYKNDPIFSNVNKDDLSALLDKSLTLHPSLSNIAWQLEQTILISQYENASDKSDFKEKIEKHLKSARAINSENLNTHNLLVNWIVAKKDFQEAKKLIQKFYQLKNESSRLRKDRINELIDQLVSSIPDFPNNEGYKAISKEFYEIHLKDIEIQDNSELLLNKSLHFININHDLKNAKKYCLQALSTKNILANYRDLIDISNAFEDGIVEDINKSLEKDKHKISMEYYRRCKHEIGLRLKQFPEAEKYLKKLFKSGSPIKNYLMNLSYLYLKTNNHQKILDMYETHKEVIEQEKLEEFIINWQLAAKILGSDLYDEVLLRNLTAQSENDEIKICAFSILDNKKEARRLIKSQIGKKYFNFYLYQRWPAIPKELFDDLEITKAA